MAHLRRGPLSRRSSAARTESTREINNSLLRCKILLECGSTGDFTYDHFLSQGQGERCPRPTTSILSGSRARTATALSHADHAFDLASNYDQPQLVAKTQLFRGHCFRRMGQWDKAYCCYIRAVSVREFAADRGPEGLEALTKECQRMLGRRRESYYSSASEHASSGYRSDEVVVRGERISSHTFGCPDTKFFKRDRDSSGDADTEASWRRISMRRDSVSPRPF
ncbi:hypothetical protein SMAC4_14115 [Sordaria macrospora]|uniref:uncharacterized protein n=1 Tax=Sordaria macrospora TaxID=5147 RepID=UPI002B2C246F|nr:hypothetical protein SMAC4_14115 [Sordaria macrospora]